MSVRQLLAGSTIRMKKTEEKKRMPAEAPAAEIPAEGAAEPLAAVDPASLTPEQLADLRQRAAKAEENWDRLLRTTAGFDNFKKRAAREKQEAIKYANESLLEKLIPVLDTFDMAMAAAQNGKSDAVQSLQAGISMVHQQLKSALAEAG